MSQRYFAVIGPGLEHALSEELKAFRTKRRSIQEGGVEFDATGVGLMEVLHWTRLASRIYLRVDSFRARDAHELYRKTKRIEWHRWLLPSSALEIHASSKHSHLHGTGEITDRVRDGIRDALQGKGTSTTSNAVTTPVSSDLSNLSVSSPTRILARLEDDTCTLNLDVAGQPLHLRGWRTHGGDAPLRENLAAALLSYLGWTPDFPLIDPMCGSGTFLIEAARTALRLPPRLPQQEHYSLHSWVNFSSEGWRGIVEPPDPSEKLTTPPLFGFDLQNAPLAEENAVHAGVRENIEFATADVSDLAPPNQPSQGGFVIANPPYGERLQQNARGQHAAWKQLIQQFAAHFQGWTLGLLLPASWQPSHPALSTELLVAFRNGGLPVRFWRLKHHQQQ